MPIKKMLFFLAVALGLLLGLTGCELPEDRFGLFGGGPDGAAPRSNFVAAYRVVRVPAGQPVPLESYHLTQDGRLGTLEIFVNDQPLRSEQTAASAFPDNLATFQILQRERPGQPDFSVLEFPAPACERLLVTGGPANAHRVERPFPAATWTVCHVWVGNVPGVYDVSLRVTDRAGRQGEMITQRIEVLEAS
jgi:hypothetical protein